MNELSAAGVQLSPPLGQLELPDHWLRTRYDCAGESIQVIHADHPAGELTIPLCGHGLTTVHMGLVNLTQSGNAAMQIRIDPGGTWRRVRPMRFVIDRHAQVQDAQLGTYDLQSNCVLRIRTEPESIAALAYIRGTSPAASSEPRCRHNAGVVFDTNMVMSTYRMDSPDDLLALLRPYTDSDFSHIFWGTTVGTYSPLYKSNVLRWHGEEKADYGFGHRTTTAEAMRMFNRQNIDPLSLAIAFAHEHGLQLWANYRISKNHKHDFVADYDGGRFLLAHQDKLVKHRDGSVHPQTNMSFAHKVIRDMAVAMLVEQAAYGVDGLFIDFCRKYPLVGWESPVVDEFKQVSGHDPHIEPTEQWRLQWFQHICSYVTLFLRELRVALEPIEQQRGNRVPIAVQVPGGWRFGEGVPTAMYDAMDPVTWAHEGLVQIVAPAEWTALMLELQCMDRLAHLIDGSQCAIWGAIGPQFGEALATTRQREEQQWLTADTDPQRLMALAHDYYQQGTAGVFIWEAHDIASVPQCWDIVRRIGDRARLKQMFGDQLGRYDGSHWIEHLPLGD